jgi:hypothetical protein
MVAVYHTIFPRTSASPRIFTITSGANHQSVLPVFCLTVVTLYPPESTPPSFPRGGAQGYESEREVNRTEVGIRNELATVYLRMPICLRLRHARYNQSRDVTLQVALHKLSLYLLAPEFRITIRSRLYRQPQQCSSPSCLTVVSSLPS